MPGPRARRLADIEPRGAKGCDRLDHFDAPAASSADNMSSTARFPKLDECAHFHYEHVELGALEVAVGEASTDCSGSYAVRITSGDACWTLQRSYDNFVMFDKQLHRCIFDRKFSSLTKLPDARPKNACDLLRDYSNRFSQLNHEGLNCGPVLNWLQLDNRGRRILVPESDSCPINTPAVAAAYAVRPYVAQAQDEISFQVGDMISVIDMPPPGESTWWRGKHGFAVGFFPAECVAVIGDKVPRHLTLSTTVRSRLPVKPVLRKHGKLIAFFRSFILNRPSRRRLKQSGILRERVFGCDLGEHLLNSGQDVPTVLTCCAEFIERHGLVDGIYRLSGVTSNIQKLRNAFDEDRVPALHSDESILQDIHSVASLLKMYFRELPNPLCTYQLYSTFVSAVQAGSDAERLRRMRDAVRKLPPPHYRTLEYLMRHLVRVAARGTETGMTPRNVAIVWAPNLLRCKELEVGGVAALQGVGVQAVVTEFLVCYAELIFGDGPVGRPKSLAITTSARLLTLEEARNRSTRGEPDYIEVGAGPAGLPLRYHTVIELPRKRNGSKRSPSLNWRALFGRSALGAMAKARPIGTPPQTETVPSSLNSLRRLRPVKSADSLDGQDGLGPLLGGPPPVRTCGHSRSVSHDSYFDDLADAPNAASPLDLSEIQLNFDLEEREMRMFSEEEGGGIASVEASPRRQRTESSQCAAATGGSKRKRSRLEERLHCDVELRFIDSQSPDQVMTAATADVHSIDTPSPLTTPGYLPLLSEASTPLTPATLQATSQSASPIIANSPRISFRSFTLPLEIDDKCDKTQTNKLKEMLNYPEKLSDRLSVNLEERNKGSLKCSERSGKTQSEHGESRDKNVTDFEKPTADPRSMASVFTDAEMTPCNELSLSLCAKAESSENTTNRSDNVGSDSSEPKIYDVKENENAASGKDSLGEISIPRLSFVNTDLDSPMSCEQTLEELQDSGFVICDSADKMFAYTTEGSRATTAANDTDDWVIVGTTTACSVLMDNAFLECEVNPTMDVPRSSLENIPSSSMDHLTLDSTTSTSMFCIGDDDDDSTETHRPTKGEDMEIFDVTNTKEAKDEEKVADGIRDEVENSSENANRYSRDVEICDIRKKQECNSRVQQQQKERKDTTRGAENMESRRRCSSRETNVRRQCAPRSLHLINHPRLADTSEQDDRTISVVTQDHRPSRLSKECQNLGCDNPREQQAAAGKSASKRKDEDDDLESDRIPGNIEVKIPSENAAEPCEIAHTPEGGASESTERPLNTSDRFSKAVSPMQRLEDAVVLRDTATILQELALQRLSGGVVEDLSGVSARRKYESETNRDRRSFDSEIGREIVRERKMRQELDYARGRSEESSLVVAQHLPPCLRARHARATRAALSRSLDEAKFNRMTIESPLSVRQSCDDAQHCSTPNVGTGSGTCSHASEKVQLKNLGGLDLGDPQCRERIERYKEERRTFLRDKYRSESFRGISSKAENDGEQALLNRLKQRASRPSLH